MYIYTTREELNTTKYSSHATNSQIVAVSYLSQEGVELSAEFLMATWRRQQHSRATQNPEIERVVRSSVARVQRD